jgi:uncharacterized glyoxalase superfamily protein PhnB
MTDELSWVRRLRRDADVTPGRFERERSELMARVTGNEAPVTSPPPGTPQIIPQLPYENVLAAIEFLERAFGFQESEGARIEHPGGVHTELELGTGRIMLGGPGGHGTFPPKGGGNPSIHLTVYVDEVDAHYERACAAGATIVEEPADKFWGDRCYEAIDPEGHRWRFHQHTGRRFAFDGS